MLSMLMTSCSDVSPNLCTQSMILEFTLLLFKNFDLIFKFTNML